MLPPKGCAWLTKRLNLFTMFAFMYWKIHISIVIIKPVFNLACVCHGPIGNVQTSWPMFALSPHLSCHPNLPRGANTCFLVNEELPQYITGLAHIHIYIFIWLFTYEDAKTRVPRMDLYPIKADSVIQYGRAPQLQLSLRGLIIKSFTYLIK